MKKILFYFIILSSFLFGQFDVDDPLKIKTKKGWAVDLDGSSEYASVTPSLRLTGKYSLRDDFSVDGMTGVANRGWVVGSGSYTVNNLVDNPLSANDYALVCQTAGVISIPCNQSVGRWSFDLYRDAAGNFPTIYFMADIVGTYSTIKGYVYYFNGTRFQFEKVTGGSASVLFNTASSYLTNQTWYHFDIYRNTNGSFSIYRNNVLISTTGGSGSNPVTDNTYTSSNYLIISFGANDRISNIQCEYGEGSLDLNGHQKFRYSFDADMEKANNWVGVSNHSVTDSVTTDKHAGTYSLAMTSSGAGGVGSYINLPSAYFTPIVAGEKYTLEYWARGTGVLGSELVTGWTNSTANALETLTSSGSAITSAINSSGSGITYSNSLNFVSGDVYKCTFDLTLNSGTAPAVSIVENGDIYDNLIVSAPQGSSNGANIMYFIATQTKNNCEIIFRVGSGVATNYSVANFSLKKVTLPTLTLSIGGQSKSFSNISCVPNTWTKCVFNFQATSNEVGQMIKLYANQADVVYLDDFSLTQAYDGLINLWHKGNTFNNHGSAYNALMGRGTGNGTFGDYGLYYQTGGTLLVKVDNADNGYGLGIATSYAVNTSTYELISLQINRTGNTTVYVNGVSAGSGSSVNIGKLVSTAVLGVGVDGNTARSCGGFIGELQITKFSDISTSNVNPLSIYKNGISKGYAGGTTVAYYKWKGSSDAEMLRDWSGVGNNLSGTNLSTADQQKGTYKAK